VDKLELVDFVMGMQALRLKSYEDRPLAFMNPEEMAASGLYYTCHGNMVCCPFCIDDYAQIAASSPVAFLELLAQRNVCDHKL
jgi:hypothetical protein